MSITKSSGNVFVDLGFEKEEAANLKIRTELIIKIHDCIEKRGLKQKDAAELLGVKQPDISAIMKGKIGLFTIDRLVNFLTRLNHTVKVTSTPSKRSSTVVEDVRDTHA
ncbi:MAG: helix-turn-helix transcriptional regulator [Proteobacteria bacterium]|nr:helix-turn-helix transcriptional regulator [Pseudomonadota bacterium]